MAVSATRTSAAGIVHDAQCELLTGKTNLRQGISFVSVCGHDCAVTPDRMIYLQEPRRRRSHDVLALIDLQIDLIATAFPLYGVVADGQLLSGDGCRMLQFQRPLVRSQCTTGSQYRYRQKDTLQT